MKWCEGVQAWAERMWPACGVFIEISYRTKHNQYSDTLHSKAMLAGCSIRPSTQISNQSVNSGHMAN